MFFKHIDTFQSFLSKLTDRKAKITISKETFEKHEIIMSIELFSSQIEDHDKNLMMNHQSVNINLGDIILNNIISIQVLLLDQPLEQKQKLITRYFDLLREALKDFYMDYQRFYWSNSYEKELSLQEFPEQFTQVLDHFIKNCINLDFKEQSLKQWIIKFSTLGFEKSVFNTKSLEIILDDDDDDDDDGNLLHQLLTLNLREMISKGMPVFYNGNFETNLVGLMENAAKNNSFMILGDDKAFSISLKKNWKALRDKQYEEFRKISHVNYEGFLNNIITLSIFLAVGNYFLSFSSLICYLFSAAILIRWTLTLEAIYKYDRIVYKQHLPSKNSYETRSTLFNRICLEYTPNKTILEIEGTKQSEKKEIEVFSFDHFTATNQGQKNAKRPRNKPISAANTKLKTTSSPIAEIATPHVWLDNNGQKFIPTYSPCKISGIHYKNPLFGYYSKDAWKAICQFYPKKKTPNQSSFFKVAKAKGDSGVVLFNKRKQKKYNAHSKVKLINNELRIFGKYVAKNEVGSSLICYDLAKEPKHKKKSN